MFPCHDIIRINISLYLWVWLLKYSCHSTLKLVRCPSLRSCRKSKAASLLAVTSDVHDIIHGAADSLAPSSLSMDLTPEVAAWGLVWVKTNISFGSLGCCLPGWDLADQEKESNAGRKTRPGKRSKHPRKPSSQLQWTKTNKCWQKNPSLWPGRINGCQRYRPVFSADGD